MDPRAIEKAESRVRSANDALARMKTASKLQEFGDRWYEFLTASKNVWTVLEQGAKPSPKSRQWLGAKKAARKDDQLLQYLYQARNDDEHGLDSSIQNVPAALAIGVAKPGFSNHMIFNGRIGAGGVLNVTSSDNRPVLVENIPAHAKLVQVRDRDRHTIYQPPTVHLGINLIDKSPIAVAEFGIAFLEKMLNEARGLV